MYLEFCIGVKLKIIVQHFNNKSLSLTCRKRGSYSSVAEAVGNYCFLD